MNHSTRQASRTVRVAVRAMILLTALLGIAYTGAVTGLGQLLLPAQANGSIVTAASGEPVGSALLGQRFDDAHGAPLRAYFQPRPSAAGDGYDGGASSGSNLGPENADLVAAIDERLDAVSRFNGVPRSAVPADAVTASASGLDPHISPEYAAIQVDRVADARGLAAEAVAAAVHEHTRGPALGYLGESTVNVLELNVALDDLED
ncbi:potassium-transporting ATPase subunit KdpC [Leucobacter zeae]|nr:potassium-transporting ATPase subunit KdpC [Leucobacter zeae]